MKQDIKKLIISTIILSSAFVLIDTFIGYIGENTLKKLPNFGNELCKTNYRLNRIKSDVIIVGSSRASHHYHTAILADSVNSYLSSNFSFYNTGLGGQFVDCNACTVESILYRYKPKLIIFDINSLEVMDIKWQERIRKYEIFYRNNKIVKEYLDRLGWKEKLKVNVNMYRFNSIIIDLIGCLHKGDITDNGYEPLYKIMENTNTKKPTTQKTIINDFSLESFIRMVFLCNKENINLIVVTSPRYKPNENNELIRSICNEYNIHYIDLYNTDFFNNHPELFYDRSHLNNDGATIYTKMFFEELKPHLEKL